MTGSRWLLMRSNNMLHARFGGEVARGLMNRA
jgi:hypothetical protein